MSRRQPRHAGAAGGRARRRARVRAAARPDPGDVVQRGVRRVRRRIRRHRRGSQSVDQIGEASMAARSSGLRRSDRVAGRGRRGGERAASALAVTLTVGRDRRTGVRPRARRTANRTSAGSGRRSTKRIGISRPTRRGRARSRSRASIPIEYARVAAAPVLALGAAGGVPGSVGVVEGDGRFRTSRRRRRSRRRTARTGSTAIRS